jgi:hypothetical protein
MVVQFNDATKHERAKKKTRKDGERAIEIVDKYLRHLASISSIKHQQTCEAY